MGLLDLILAPFGYHAAVIPTTHAVLAVGPEDSGLVFRGNVPTAMVSNLDSEHAVDSRSRLKVAMLIFKEDNEDLLLELIGRESELAKQSGMDLETYTDRRIMDQRLEDQKKIAS